MIFVTDANGQTIYTGNEWETLTGQNIGESLGLGWLDRVHPDDRKVVLDTLEEARKAISQFSIRYRVIRPGGSMIWVAVGCIPSIGPPDHSFIGYLGSLTELAPPSSNSMTAYGNVNTFVPPPSRAEPMAADHLDQIADHLILTNSLIEANGPEAALPGVRYALYQIGLALAARSLRPKTIN